MPRLCGQTGLYIVSSWSTWTAEGDLKSKQQQNILIWRKAVSIKTAPLPHLWEVIPLSQWDHQVTLPMAELGLSWSLWDPWEPCQMRFREGSRTRGAHGQLSRAYVDGSIYWRPFLPSSSLPPRQPRPVLVLQAHLPLGEHLLQPGCGLLLPVWGWRWWR